MFYDLRRAVGILAALAAVAAVMGIHGLILHATLRRADRWLHERDQTFLVPVNVEAGARRLLAIAGEMAARPADRPERLGLLVGPSVLQQGIDPALLTSELGGGRRWANLLCPALAYESDLFVKLIYRSGVHPDALILVCNPGILVPNQDTQADRVWYDPKILLDHLARRQLENARGDLVELTLVPWHLAFPYRGQVFTAVDRALYAARLGMFQAGGTGLDALYAPAPNPWVEPYPEDQSASEEGNQAILRFIGRKGWYEPSLYRDDGRNFDLICDLFRVVHEHGTRGFLLLVPESSTYRDRLPADAAAPIERALPRVLGAAAPVVLDYREALPDRDFFNVNHLSRPGRIELTKRLARDLGRHLKREPGPPSP